MFKTRPITYSEKLCDTKSHRHIASELSLKPFVSGGGMTRLPHRVPPRCGDNRHNMQPCVLLAKMKDVPWGEDAILLSYQHLPCEQDNKSQSAGLETFSVRFVKQIISHNNTVEYKHMITLTDKILHLMHIFKF